MKTLVLLAHPGFTDRSIANRIIIEGIQSLEQVTVKDLYGKCPSFRFDVDAEQKALGVAS